MISNLLTPPKLTFGNGMQTTTPATRATGSYRNILGNRQDTGIVPQYGNNTSFALGGNSGLVPTQSSSNTGSTALGSSSTGSVSGVLPPPQYSSASSAGGPVAPTAPIQSGLPAGYTVGSKGEWNPTPTFSGLVGSAAGAAGATAGQAGILNNQSGILNNQSGILNNQAGSINTTAGLIGSQGQVTPEEQAAKDKLAGVPGLLGSTNAAIENQPGQFAFQMGREAVAGRNIEAMRQSLAAQAEAYATTRQANTTAYTGQANAQNQAGGLQNAAGGLQNSAGGLQNNAGGLYNSASGAYNNAAGTIAPQLGQYGQPYYDPLNPGGGGATGVQPSDPYYQTLQQYAQMAANNQLGGIPSSVTSNPVLNAQVLQMAKQINPSFNYNTATGAGAAQQSNAQVGGTAATGAAASGLQSATQNYVSANTAYTTAQNQASNLQQTMSSTGINTNPRFVNSKINSLQNQLGSANYASFVTALSEAQQAYTSLLSSVGASTPTVNGQQATAIFSPDSTPGQINAAIAALNQAAYAKLKPMYDQIGTYSSQLGQTGSSGANSSHNATDYNF